MHLRLAEELLPVSVSREQDGVSDDNLHSLRPRHSDVKTLAVCEESQACLIDTDT